MSPSKARANEVERTSNTSGVRRKFPRGGAKFCHNRVTSQINFRGSAEGMTILGSAEACPRENFAKLHQKYAFFCILEASFSIMLLLDLLAGEKEN